MKKEIISYQDLINLVKKLKANEEIIISKNSVKVVIRDE